MATLAILTFLARSEIVEEEELEEGEDLELEVLEGFDDEDFTD